MAQSRNQLCERDILCTKDKSSLTHSGNRLFRQVIEQKAPLYKNAKNKVQKMRITKDIMVLLKQTYDCRFVRFDKPSASWVEVPDHTGREKVGHALRFALRREKVRLSSSRSDAKKMAGRGNVAIEEVPSWDSLSASNHSASSEEEPTPGSQAVPPNTLSQHHLRAANPQAFAAKVDDSAARPHAAENSRQSRFLRTEQQSANRRIAASDHQDGKADAPILLGQPLQSFSSKDFDFLWDAGLLASQEHLRKGFV